MIEDSSEKDGRTEQGMSNPTACQAILTRLLKPAQNSSCSPKPCTIGSRYQPPFGDLAFFATSAFRYAPTELETIEADGKLNVTKLKKVAEEYCSMNVTAAVASKPKIKREWASMRCLQGLYIPTLLHALGFQPDTSRITIAGEMNGQGIDWALGQMVQQLSMDWMRETSDVSSSSATGPRWLPTVTFFNAIALLFLFL